MLCMNLPRQKTSKLQVLICIVLIAATLVCSFMPLITLKITDKESADQIREIAAKANVNDLGEIPEKLEVSAPKLFGTIKLMTKLVKIASNTAQSTKDGMEVDVKQTADDLKKTLLNDDGTLREETKDTLLVAAAVAVTFTTAMKGDKNEDGTTSSGNTTLAGTVLNVLIVVFALLYMLIFTLLAPVIYIFMALTAIIPAVKSISDPTGVTAKVARKLPGAIMYPMIFILFTCIIPTMSYGVGAFGLWILAFICTGVNVIFSRLHAWDKKDITYANIVQGVSLVSVLGFLIYFFNVLKAGVFHSFVSGEWSTYMVKVAALTALNKEPASKAYSTDALLIILAVILTLVSLRYFAAVLQRVSLAVKRKKNGDAHESHLVFAIVMMFIVILPKYVAGAAHCFDDAEKATGNPRSFLQLTDAQNTALNMMLVGLTIVLLSEIALLVLKKVFCKDLAREDADAILSGNVKTPEEKLEAAKAALAAAEAAAAEAASVAEAAKAQVENSENAQQ